MRNQWMKSSKVPDSDFCQVSYATLENCPSEVGTEAVHHHLQANRSLLHSSGMEFDDLRPGFGRNAPHVLENEPFHNLVITWTCPPQFILDDKWHVAAGEQSEESKAQNERESSTLEAIYPCLYAIPPSPSVSQGVEEHAYDDCQTPLIPNTPVEEEDVPHLPGPETVPGPRDAILTPTIPKPDPVFKAGDAEADVIAAASAAFTAIMKSNEKGSLIDTDLLIQILADPTMLDKLKGFSSLGREDAASAYEPKQKPTMAPMSHISLRAQLANNLKDSSLETLSLSKDNNERELNSNRLCLNSAWLAKQAPMKHIRLEAQPDELFLGSSSVQRSLNLEALRSSLDHHALELDSARFGMNPAVLTKLAPTYIPPTDCFPKTTQSDSNERPAPEPEIVALGLMTEAEPRVVPHQPVKEPSSKPVSNTLLNCSPCNAVTSLLSQKLTYEFPDSPHLSISRSKITVPSVSFPSLESPAMVTLDLKCLQSKKPTNSYAAPRSDPNMVPSRRPVAGILDPSLRPTGHSFQFPSPSSSPNRVVTPSHTDPSYYKILVKLHGKEIDEAQDRVTMTRQNGILSFREPEQAAQSRGNATCHSGVLVSQETERVVSRGNEARERVDMMTHHSCVLGYRVPERVKSRGGSPRQKTSKPCMYFRSSKGCRNGSGCPYRHDTGPFLRTGSIMLEERNSKRIKFTREIA